ncbi:hypothetical protein ACH5RR_036586 [Cinchona calisaya]|uniref:NADP-dependent oxidoreductase domain-containing protein n=1 Tax=Cinchona calisaya TaxID=153742 RepID=A0ABD2Y3M1_9GENT
MTTVPQVTLSSYCENSIPVIGMGTSAYPQVDLETTKSAIIEAIKSGYRHFDTAFIYGSEKPLGEAIAEALKLGLIKSRDEVFVTTKLWCSFADPDQVVPACKMSIQNLQLDYVDMYLAHWPFKLTEMIPKKPVERDTIRPLDMKGVWEGMEECQKLGLTKGIGVSNFTCKKLEEVLSVTTIPPVVNQVELNPVWQQKKLIEFCKAKGIHITAYSPLGANNTQWGDNRVMNSDVLGEIAKARRKTNAQELQKISQIPQRKGVTLASLLGPVDIALEFDSEV